MAADKKPRFPGVLASHSEECGALLVRHHAYHTVLWPALESEFHLAVGLGEQRVVTAHAHVHARTILGAALAHDDIAGVHLLAAVEFDAETFRLGIAAVTGAAACFLVCHVGMPRYSTDVDTGNLNLGVVLPMAGTAPVILAAAHLKDKNFVIAPGGFDGAGNFATGDERRAQQRRLLIAANHEHAVEFHRGAGLDLELLAANQIALTHPVLLATGLNHRVHGNSKAGESRQRARILRPWRMPVKPSACALTPPEGTPSIGFACLPGRNPAPLMALAPDSVTPARIPELGALRALVGEDFRATDSVIREALRSDVALIGQLGEYIIKGGGKRLRPLLVLLAARACGASDQRHIQLAAIIEFIHTATLLHDDVVDASGLRRGRKTANAIWGNEASVLVGDFLYSRAFQMMVTLDDMRVMHILADATNLIAEGEVMQLLNCHDPETTEARYLQVIRRKTATLFQAGAHLAAVIARRPETQAAALDSYGLHLGSAFQLVDDTLDYSASSVEMGKNTGDDLAEGKPTLPLIYAMHQGTPAERQCIRAAIESGERGNIDNILPILQRTGALEYTLSRAHQERERAVAALEMLPESAYKTALVDLADFSVERRT